MIKKQEDRELLVKLTGTKVPFLSDLPITNIFFKRYKMNAMVNKLLLAGDRFMPGIHLIYP